MKKIAMPVYFFPGIHQGKKVKTETQEIFLWSYFGDFFQKKFEKNIPQNNS